MCAKWQQWSKDTVQAQLLTMCTFQLGGYSYKELKAECQASVSRPQASSPQSGSFFPLLILTEKEENRVALSPGCILGPLGSFGNVLLSTCRARIGLRWSPGISFFFFFFFNLLEYWLVTLYKCQVYFIIRFCILYCMLHPKSSLLPSPCTWPL